jgi:hypothetical protein
VEVLLVLAVVTAAAAVVLAPLRHRRVPGTGAEAAERSELEAAKEAKYREIRDAELDYRTGKLSREDWRSLDGALRTEAAQLLDRLDAVAAESPPFEG